LAKNDVISSISDVTFSASDTPMIAGDVTFIADAIPLAEKDVTRYQCHPFSP
jgi:hypothetical protein